VSEGTNGRVSGQAPVGKAGGAGVRPIVNEVAAPVAAFLESLDLEVAAANLYRGEAAAGNRRRVFGGLAMGQALVAAARTLPSGRLGVRSLHCVFARAGDPTEPITYAVEPRSDGRRFVTRAVTARQGDTVLFDALVRFGDGEPGPDQQRPRRPLGLPGPEGLPDYPTVLQPQRERLPDWARGDLPVDLRLIDDAPAGEQLMWLRAVDALPDDPILHASALLYASDMTLLGVAATPFGLDWTSPDVTMASLDHAIWFHRAPRVDEWLLYHQHAVTNASSLALTTGSVFAADGRLVATVMQDGFVHLPDGASPTPRRG
jgi:acyl-CoA thioesterase-2